MPHSTHRVRCAAASALLLCSAMLAATHARPLQQRLRELPPEAEAAIRGAIDNYAAGDDDAPRRWLMTATDRARLRHLQAYVDRTREDWSRAKALFLLEVGAALPPVDLMRGSFFLEETIAFLTVPRAVQTRGDDLFHLKALEIAIGLAQGTQQYWLQQQAVDGALQQVARMRARDVEVDSRAPLASAIAAAGLCCWRPQPGEMIQMVVRAPPGRLRAEDAVARFEAAASHPSLRTEALVRLAVFLQSIERRDALSAFARIPPHDDPVLGVAQHIAHGRLLDALERPMDAAGAYRRAFEFDPNEQAAAIGLAAALLRAGRPDEASIAAAAARTSTPRVVPYYVAYREADRRFVPEWLARLRRDR